MQRLHSLEYFLSCNLDIASELAGDNVCEQRKYTLNK